jgi:hypothetical protein
MFHKHRSNFFWLAIIAIIAVGVGAAFTAANTFDTHAGATLGYGTQNVTGANVTSMHYTLHSDGVHIDAVTFVADGDLTAGVPKEHGFVGFTVGSTPGPTVDCGVGVYDGSTSTTFTCNTTTLNQPVATVAATDIAVSN